MSSLAGFRPLVRFVLRQDRVRLPVWILAIVGTVVSSAASYPETFPTAADRQSRADLLDNPATTAFTGPGHGTADYTYGAMIANEMLSLTAILVAIMSILMVIRHTRAEEESGRDELVRATAVGRHATAAAALFVVVLANLVVGLLIALGLPASVPELSQGSSLLFGVAVAAVGVVFAAVAAVTAQLTESSRAASGTALAIFGAAFVLRALGDIGNGVLSWLSPVGWSQATRVYVADRWWPLALAVLAAAVTTAAALVLGNRRDLGAGILSQRPGPAAAAPLLGRPVGFALRLQRSSLIGWGSGILLAGVAYGSLAGEAADFVAENETVAEVFASAGRGTVTEQFFATILALIALLSIGYGLQAALRLRSEESSARVEPLLATPLDRRRWAGGQLAVAMGGALAVQVVGGLGLGVSAALSLGDAAEVPRMLGGALVHVPAIWAVIAVAAALFGLLPRAVLAAWVLLGYAAFVSMYGPLLDLPGWLSNLTPLGHVPQVPAESVDAVPLVVLLAGTVVLLVAGLAGLRRRDLQLS